MNIMIDIETLGTKPGSLILSVGGCAFDDEQGVFGEFYYNVEPLSSLLAGFIVDPDTVRFWNGQSPETKAILFNKPVSIAKVLNELAIYIHPEDYVWAKGPDFDLVLLQTAYEKLGEKIPWRFRNTRDVRTILDVGHRMGILANELYPPHPQKHSALEDAKYQANQVITVFNKGDLWKEK